MRHGVKNKKLGVNAEHKKAILRSLSTAILKKGLAADVVDRQVRTTLAKAKMVRSVVDRLITYAKKGDLAARRQAARYITDPEVLKGLFETIAPRYANRPGGYTRVLKLATNRPGDASEMALIGLVEDTIVEKKRPRAQKASVKAKPSKKVDIAVPGAEEKKE